MVVVVVVVMVAAVVEVEARLGDTEGDAADDDGVMSPDGIKDCRSDWRRAKARALVCCRISWSFSGVKVKYRYWVDCR